jgi:hypothetical protein
VETEIVSPEPNVLKTDDFVPVKPKLYKNNVQNPKDISLVTRIIQNYKEKP